MLAPKLTITGSSDPSKDFISAQIAEMRAKAMTRVQGKREMLIDFYESRQDKEEYLANYGFDNIEQPLPYSFVQMTRKFVNKLSLVYKYAPDRALKGIENDPYNEWITKNPEFNISLKTAERYKNLLHNIIYRPSYTRNGWKFYIDIEWIPYFLDGDPFNPVAYSIPIKQELTQVDSKLVKEDWFMFWSKDEYFWHTMADDRIDFKNVMPDPSGWYEDMQNPFGRLPFVEMRKGLAVNDYWPDGSIALAKANQKVNICWMDRFYGHHNQSHGQPWISGIAEHEQKQLEIGSHKVWTLPEGSSVGSIDFNSKLTESNETIREMIQTTAHTLGLSVEWSQDGDPSSGFALLVKNIDMMEERQDDIEFCEGYEKEIYDIIRVQAEMFNIDPKLPEDKLIVDFQDMQFPVNQAEDIQKEQHELDNNIISIIDAIQRRNTDMNEEEALDKLQKNKEINTEWTARQTLLREELTRQGAEIVNEPEE